VNQIFSFFETLLEKHPIKSAAVEKLFFTSYNQSNAEFVYGIRGALMMLLLRK
jgi:Holliday junction resolvasome RuvABC endonuclease subunit